MATATKREPYVGSVVPRKEDPRLLTGQGRFIDNLSLPGMLWFAVVRSPLAHARITGVDVSRALEAPGVVAAFSGEDLASEWIGSLPMAWPVTEDIKAPPHWPVARDKVRYAGDAVAVVVAGSRAQAEDAAELVEAGYEALPVVVDLEAAMAEDAPLVHEDLGTNRCYTWTHSTGEIDQVFADAPVVVSERYYHPRLIPSAMEPRGLMVQPSPADGEFTLWSSTQIPHVLKVTLAAFTLGIPETKLRVIAPDVGGGFGSKLDVYAEEAIGVALARRLGRPVKWIEARSEGYLATIHGRHMIQDIELAATDEGRLLGVRVKLIAGMGAYLQLIAPGIPILGAFLYAGPYKAEAYSFECTGVFTNQTPTDAYRGAGRPEATYAIERAMDALARRLGKDPAGIRRLNLMGPFSEATPSVTGISFDSGNYEASLDKALELASYGELRREQRARFELRPGHDDPVLRRQDAKLLGIGLSTYIEGCGWAPSRILGQIRYAGGGWEAATVRMLPTGKVVVVTGTSPHGQGHDTVWSQIVADALGVDFDDVEVLHGDTAISALGWDTYGSRSVAVGGVAVQQASGKVIDKARKIAAHQLEVDDADLVYDNGRFSVKGAPKRGLTIGDLALQAWTAHNLPEGLEPGLEGTAVFDPPNLTYPSGTHICIVEVDTETGEVKIVNYVAVDDCGVVVNPQIVEGQVHGGIAQGIAEAAFEEAIYDDGGNLLTGSMMNYLVPSSAELPSFVVDRTVTPSSTNPMGVKGVGETGTIAAPPAVVNAVIDALAPLGVTHIDMPVTPERVWRAIQQAKGGRA